MRAGNALAAAVAALTIVDLGITRGAFGSRLSRPDAEPDL
jgi:hypothetical protein